MILSQDGQYTPGRETRWKEGIDLIIKLLKDTKRKDKIRVLDAGCGECSCFTFLTQRMQKENSPQNELEYNAVDNNEELIELLKNTKVLFKLGDFTKLNELYPKNFFDVIIASEVLEHVTDTDAFILSLKDILKDDGYIYVTTPNLASWHGRLALLFGIQPLATEVSSVRAEFGKGNWLKKYYHGKAIGHIRVFTLKALIDFLHYHSFNIVKIYGGGYRKLDSLIFQNHFIGLSAILKVILKKKL